MKSYTGIDFRSRNNCRVVIDDKKSLYVILIPNDLTYGDSFWKPARGNLVNQFTIQYILIDKSFNRA
jgi:hypothetical protein